MYRRGDMYSTNSLTLFLNMHASDKLPPESGMMIEMTLTILKQTHGQHYKVSGSSLRSSFQCLVKSINICSDCLCLQLILLNLFQSQADLCLLVSLAGDGPTSSRSARSRTCPEAILWDRAALSRQMSLSLGHQMMVS